MRVLMILAMACAAGFCITVAVLVLRSSLNRKKLWALASLIGVGAVYLDPDTGALGFNPLSLQLLSVGFAKAPPAGSWVLSAAFPVGAVAALLKLRWARAASRPPGDTV